MNKQSWLIGLFVYLLVCSCKVSNETLSRKTDSSDEKQQEQIVQQESLDALLTKKTTLVKKVVFYKETKLNNGVQEYYLEYISDKNLPMVMFLLKADLRNKDVVLKPLIPNGQLTFGMQTIPDMIGSNRFEGYKIIAAVNSDYFDMKTGEPRGITIIDGIPIKATTTSTRSYFGVTKTGNPIVGDMQVFASQKNMLQHSLGGFQKLVENGKSRNQTDISVHPRTAVGFTANKEVYFLVVDGRSEAYSNGLMLHELAEVFYALGVQEAVNLDGGGSSTFATVMQSNVIIKNRPSDGKPRKVANGWAICIKQQ